MFLLLRAADTDDRDQPGRMPLLLRLLDLTVASHVALPSCIPSWTPPTYSPLLSRRSPEGSSDRNKTRNLAATPETISTSEQTTSPVQEHPLSEIAAV
ncbi:MAG: hypothetical protein GWP18_06870 [Proteobacteria bacterium]|nr:hypothetical protein [Pseudomonadota bacterium]